MRLLESKKLPGQLHADSLFLVKERCLGPPKTILGKRESNNFPPFFLFPTSWGLTSGELSVPGKVINQGGDKPPQSQQTQRILSNYRGQVESQDAETILENVRSLVLSKNDTICRDDWACLCWFPQCPPAPSDGPIFPPPSPTDQRELVTSSCGRNQLLCQWPPTWDQAHASISQA